jgi:hypothetical protein
MILLLRALARLVTLLLLAFLAACGLAIAIFSIGWSRTGDFNLPGLARLVHLGALRDQVGELLHDLAGPGPVAGIAALCGLGAIALGLWLLVGALWPRRERLVILDRAKEGTLAARRRVLARVASALAEQTRGVDRHQGQGQTRPPARGAACGARRPLAHPGAPKYPPTHPLALAPLTEAFGLRARVQPRLGQRGRRVE